jgi:hypothetical protein
MTEHVVRLYAAAVALVVFFLFWAVIAARPWAAAGESDPRMEALQRREVKLQRETRRVNRVVKHRFARYERQLARRKRAIRRRERENAAILAASSAVSAGAGGSSSAGLSPGGTASAPAAAAPVTVTAAPPVTTTSSS